jgi:hypothetical protein
MGRVDRVHREEAGLAARSPVWPQPWCLLGGRDWGHEPESERELSSPETTPHGCAALTKAEQVPRPNSRAT